MKHGTFYISSHEKSLLNRLRMNQSESNFTLWSHSDNSSHVLGTWERGELISSMQLEIIYTQDHFEERFPKGLEHSFMQNTQMRFPVGILSQGVSSQKASTEKLKALLGYHLLNIAEKNKVFHVYATLKKNSSFRDSFNGVPYRSLSYSEKLDLIHLDIKKDKKVLLAAFAKVAAETLLLYPWIPCDKKRRSEA